MKLKFSHLRALALATTAVIGIATPALAQDTAFAGFVIHHYGSYRRWLGR